VDPVVICNQLAIHIHAAAVAGADRNHVQSIRGNTNPARIAYGIVLATILSHGVVQILDATLLDWLHRREIG